MPTRQLAAILFSDISGFTAVMEINEEKAMQMLAKNREIHKQVVTHFGGTLIKEIGDGMLCRFDTITQSLDAALELQKKVKEHQGLHLGIGIHAGEIIYKEKDIFGDAVNLASRIQSLSKAGSILVTDKIYQEITNKKQYQIKLLGSFHFKNVQNPTLVYAITNEGIYVPLKKEISGKLKTPTSAYQKIVLSIAITAAIIYFSWFQFFPKSINITSEITEIPIVYVSTFENKSTDSSLNYFGYMARDWMNQGFIETGKISVIKEDAYQKSTKPIHHIPASANTHIKGIIYEFSENEYMITVEVVDVITDQIKYAIKSSHFTKKDFNKTLEDLSQQLLGYFLSGETKLTQGQLPPKYNAYETYLKGQQTPSFQSYQKLQFFLKAIELDSTFVNPYFSILELASTWGYQNLTDSTILLLEKRSAMLSEFQFLQFEAYKARIRGDLERSSDLQWKLYTQYKVESGATKAIYYDVSSNKATDAVYKYHQYRPINKSILTSNYKEQAYLGEVYEAYCALEQFDSVIYWIHKNKIPVLHFTVALAHLEATLHLKKWVALDSLLESYTNNLNVDQQLYTKPALYWKICSELFLLQETEKLSHYLNLMEKVNEENPANMFYHYYKGMALFLKGNYQDAAREQVLHYDQTPQFRFFIAFPAICYLKSEQLDKAKEWMKKIQSIGSGYPGQLEYANAVFYCHLKNYEKAMYHLSRALSQGYEFDFYSYQNDFLLKDLFSYKAFLDFTKAK
ncbi:MAG: adenylate/guanylate cyclase domain-containing protein [Saprospiraceae bacterium]|nr:adenylate/guanylate cyclase domain-containing protein [Saprospiraceae bacterium]